MAWQVMLKLRCV